MELVFKLVGGLFVGILFYVFVQPRRKKMHEVLDEPETAAEQAARKQVPHELRGLTTEELKDGLRTDLKNAASYLKSVQGSLKGASVPYSLSVAEEAFDNDLVHPRGASDEITSAVLDDLMHAEQFLVLITHRMRLLEVESPERFVTDWSDPDFFRGLGGGQIQYLKVCVDELLGSIQQLEV